MSPPFDASGEYEMTGTVAMDTCNMVWPTPVDGPMLLEQKDRDVFVTGLSSSGECLNYTYHLSGTTMNSNDRGYMTWGSCTMYVTATSNFAFSGSHASGEETYHFTYSSGNCGGITTCDLRFESTLDKCDGCWPGCPGSATASASAPGGMLGVMRPEALSKGPGTLAPR